HSTPGREATLDDVRYGWHQAALVGYEGAAAPSARKGQDERALRFATGSPLLASPPPCCSVARVKPSFALARFIVGVRSPPHRFPSSTPGMKQRYARIVCGADLAWRVALSLTQSGMYIPQARTRADFALAPI